MNIYVWRAELPSIYSGRKLFFFYMNTIVMKEKLIFKSWISASTGEGLWFQSGYLEFWNHCHWARHRGGTVSQIPTNEGESSAEQSHLPKMCC